MRQAQADLHVTRPRLFPGLGSEETITEAIPVFGQLDIRHRLAHGVSSSTGRHLGGVRSKGPYDRAEREATGAWRFHAEGFQRITREQKG